VLLIDLGFILAVVAFGWGLSLATYRAFAGRIGWPMGAWHKQRPVLPIVVGIVAILLASLYRLPTERCGNPGIRRCMGGLLDGLPARWRAERPAAGPGRGRAACRALAGLIGHGCRRPSRRLCRVPSLSGVGLRNSDKLAPPPYKEAAGKLDSTTHVRPHVRPQT